MKIYINAYVNQNLGDDLFIKILIERYPNAKFYLREVKKINLKKYFNYSNLQISKYSLVKKMINFFLKKSKISKNYLEKKFLETNKIGLIVEIGGSIFMENENTKINKLALEIRKDNLKHVNGNYFVLGANFGPYKSLSYKEEYKKFFFECKDVCFREIYSKNLFKDLLNIRCAKDIVFSLKTEEVELEEKYILISVINPEKKNELKNKKEKYYEKVIEIIKELVKLDKKIVLMSFCKNEGDEEAIKIIKKNLSEEHLKNIDEYFYSGNIEKALEIIKKSEVIIATRFHAMILGFIYKKKVFPIAYSNKTTNVLRDLGFEGEYCTFEILDNISVEKILMAKRLDETNLKNAKCEAEKHFEKLDKYLKDKK